LPLRAPPFPLRNCNQGAIESALATPSAAFGGEEVYPDLPSKAAVLLYSLAKSQACVDGNKRVALILTYAFLDLNDATLAATNEEVVDRILEVASSDPKDRDAVIAATTAWMVTAVVGGP
jgi:death-on-curing protein